MWIIRKASRIELVPYQNVDTCNLANVPCGHIYADKNQALIDVQKLSKVNPVGFEVVEYATP
jgi:hypothetical protein